MRSNDYSTTKIFVDIFLLSMLLIMSANRFSPRLLWCFYQLFGSHSDGTHSLQRIHWWVSDVMLNFSKSVLMKKQTHLQPVKLQFLHIFFLWQYTGTILNNYWHYKYWQSRSFNKLVFVDGHLVAAYDDAVSSLKLGGKNNISAATAC